MVFALGGGVKVAGMDFVVHGAGWGREGLIVRFTHPPSRMAKKQSVLLGEGRRASEDYTSFTGMVVGRGWNEDALLGANTEARRGSDQTPLEFHNPKRDFPGAPCS